MKKQPSQTISIKRVSWIDVCRGIGILLVLYGHLLSGDNHRYFIYSFHMPLFFFLSGLVFKPVSDKPFWEVTKKYFKQLLLPYFIFALSTYLFAQITNPGRDMSPTGILYQLYGILYGSGNMGMLGFNVILWFLPCLFITKITFALLTKKITQAKWIGLVLLLCGVSGYSLSVFVPWLKLPLGFEIALTSIVFFGIGYLWKMRKYTLAFLKRYRAPLAVMALAITYITATQNFHIDHYQTDLRTNRLGNFFFFYSSALSGIFSCLMVSQVIGKNKILEYLGKHSMVLFAWHYLLFVNMKVIINTFLSDEIINSIKLVLPTFYVASATVIILFSQKMIHKLKTAYRFFPI